jgi:K+-sensing histidine kinase KdpD
LEVGDTGGGVPFADREKIFEAFFTTKDTGEGTGLGLAVAKGIIKDHDGWIEVDDRPQGGALFRVFLPVTTFSPGDDTGDGDGAPDRQPIELATDAELAEPERMGKH